MANLQLFKIAYFTKDDDIVEARRYSRSLPILLAGEIQRSGGTLFSQLFDGHPEVLAHPDEVILLKQKNPTVARRNKAFLLAVRPMIKASTKGYKKGRWSKETHEVNFLHDQFVKEFSKQSILDSSEIVSYYFDNFFKYWLDLSQERLERAKLITGFAPRVGGNNPHDLLARNPRINVVHIFRDPCSWWASSKTYSARHGEKYGAIESIRKHWKANQKTAISLLETYPDRVFIISFKDLIQNTGKIMDTFCDWFGLEFDDILLKPTFIGELIESDSSVEKDVTLGAISEKPLYRYRNMLSSEEIDYITTEYGDVCKTMESLSLSAG